MTTQPAADFWHDKTVIVPGGADFLGRAVVAALLVRSCALNFHTATQGFASEWHSG